MHWGRDPVLEKHYVPTRSQRARSVLTFFAQDSGTHNLVYANADISKATQHREAIAFCDHWKTVSGADPKMLVMDQKVTTQPVLGDLDGRGIKFLTLRMRSPALVKHISRLRPADYTTITLDPSGSNAAPTHPSSARPGCPQPPQSPGWATGPCTTSTPEPCAEPAAWKSALIGGSIRPVLAEPGDVLAEHVLHLAVEVHDQAQFLVTVLLSQPLPGPDHRQEDRGHVAQRALGDQPDNHASTVRCITFAPNESGLLEPVDDTGDRGRAQAGGLG